MVENNPFLWKGHYYDRETDLYYVGGRFYSPALMQYLDADDPENLISSASVPNSLDRNAITLDNSISFAPNPHTVFPMGDLKPQDPVDENADKTWWQVNWRKAVQWIAFALVLTASVVLACIPGTQALGIGMLMAGAKAAVSGFIAGAIIGGIISAIAGQGFWQGVIGGAVYGAIGGFTTGAIMGLVQGLATMQQVKPAKVCTEKNSNCFIAGTLDSCLTVDGKKPTGPLKKCKSVTWSFPLTRKAKSCSAIFIIKEESKLIVFEGDLSEASKKFMLKEHMKTAWTIATIVTIPFMAFWIWMSVAVSIALLGFGIIGCPLAFVCIVLGMKPEKKHYGTIMPGSVIIEEDVISAELVNTCLTRNLEDLKRIDDYGEWYYFRFYGSGRGYFICQKDLIIQGTIEELEQRFEEYIVRKPF